MKRKTARDRQHTHKTHLCYNEIKRIWGWISTKKMAKVGVVLLRYKKKHGTGEGVSANETREATDKIQTLQKNNKEAVDESLGDMEGTVSTSVNHALK